MHTTERKIDMKQMQSLNVKPYCECRTLRVEDCAAVLGIGRSAAYTLVRNAESNGGTPFRVMRVGTSLLISKKSFDEYLNTNGL